MPYIKPTESDEISLPSDPAYKIRLKKRSTFGDQLAVQRAMSKIEGGAVVGIDGGWVDGLHSLAVAMIVSWNLTDENDQPLPITPASLALLSPEDGAFLIAEVTKRSQTRAVEQERPFALPLSNS